MRIEWRQGHTGQAWAAYVDGQPVGEVVSYGFAYGQPGSVPTYWVAWVHRQRLPGEHATLDEAKGAVVTRVAMNGCIASDELAFAKLAVRAHGRAKIDEPAPRRLLAD